MIVGVVREIYPDEKRVAFVPAVVPTLVKAGLEVHVESGAGVAAGYPDQVYAEKGAKVVASRAEVFASADVLLQLLVHGANDRNGADDVKLLRKGQVVVGFCRSLASPQTVRELAASGATVFAIELLPRITRAQSMDALSSMATVAGYKAVLLAADRIPRMFPMMTTAAGTIPPAKVLVIGAGVAGLQAMATAKRLGAVVSGYDVRPAAKEQVMSLGAKFVELPLEVKNAEDSRGYATAQDEAFYDRQRELLGQVVSQHDVVISAAIIPGKKAPLLVKTNAIAAMSPGSVVVDLAAERGGNCEPTKPNETVDVNGVTVIGSFNLAGGAPYHASQLYARNLAHFVQLIVKKGKLELDLNDEIIRETLLTKDGEVVHARVKELVAAQPGKAA